MNLRLAIFASGRGSNFQAILQAIATQRLKAQVMLCVSNRADAGALQIARAAQIPTAVIEEKQFADAADYASALLAELAKHDANFIALAGFMRKIPVEVVRQFRHRLVNIHPALLPSFGGKGMYGHHVHEAVLAYGCKVTGATVHFVDEDYDTGPPILQRCIAVLDDDTAETLAARVLEIEHQIYPEALQLFAEERVRVEGRKIKILPKVAM
ncbi:MAG: phosphoribosylglycinamide formyltransferase [candidate division KSB1 bacterium]|nr:phosphoribosylglycinamide formyltransferase [candidate division KSB1 bacterium]MDZ7368505.1 phosphoribosylglycinamide formyltransferase [candidate division KSB1 bacterium]MDZ7406267.1 phosphoribosylglycinamide formyltransferase [candidate division KSB1 bacterium]